jgi:8-oxo-dGTP diphosphatase
MEPKLFVATKAFIIHNGKVLCLRESTSYSDAANVGSFDLVGGRLKPGERFDEALAREIFEETGLQVTIGKPFFVNEWRPVVRDEQWQIVGIFFECFADTDKVTLSNDHAEYIWIDPQDYKTITIIPNLGVVFESYLAK